MLWILCPGFRARLKTAFCEIVRSTLYSKAVKQCLFFHNKTGAVPGKHVDVCRELSPFFRQFKSSLFSRFV